MWKNNNHYNQDVQAVTASLIKNQYEFKQTAKDLCEKALVDAKSELHPLLRQVDLDRLDQRCNFLKAFKCALERRVAQQIMLWLPVVKAAYRFDPLMKNDSQNWDNTIHLLVLVPQIMSPFDELGANLDHEILQQLKDFNWTRFQYSKSLVDIRQVTLYEIHPGICAGAMFYSAYTVPAQICPAI